MKEAIIILVTLGLAALSVFVQFEKDKDKRKKIEQALEVPAGVAFIVTLFFTAVNFRELNKIALMIALIILLVPFFLYPFSPAHKDENKSDDAARPSHARKRYSQPLDRISQNRPEVTYGTAHSQFRHRPVSRTQSAYEAREAHQEDFEGHTVHHSAGSDLP